MRLLRTKIVCTLGPASSDPKTMRALVQSGMSVARLNFSHGDYATHTGTLETLRAITAELGKPVAVLADLQGPKLRVGKMQGEGVELHAGQEITLTNREVEGHENVVPIKFPDLPRVVQPGERILLDDGLIELEVHSTADTDIVTRVVVGGLLKSNKGMNLPDASLAIAAITEKDREDLAFALDQQVDWVALSFVRSANDVLELKDLIQQQAAFGRPIPVIAKIEKPEALKNIEAIVEASDAVMVARGDLGIELPPERVPLIQKHIIQLCNAKGRPVITATQMLDSMIRNPRPTRAEASDVANAILDGTDAIMLSGETAAGEYPVEAVQTMARITAEVEQGIRDWQSEVRPRRESTTAVTAAVCHATSETADDLRAAAIITPTVSGRTARTMSMYRPHAPIIAATPSPMVQRQLMLYWGVYPLISRRLENTDAMIDDAVQVARTAGLLQEGDVVVITAGAAGSAPGTTDLMKVHIIERILGRGAGIGGRSVAGRVRIIETPVRHAMYIDSRDILVMQRSDRTSLPLVQRAGGLITVEGGLNSHAAVLAVELGVPAVIGMENALEVLSDGQAITLDAQNGVVFERSI